MPTIGVSLAVPEPWGQELQDYRVSLGDQAAVHIPTHITLLPPTDVAEADVPGLDEQVLIRFEGLEPLPATVCWVRGFDVGLEFGRAIHPAVFDHLMGRLGAKCPCMSDAEHARWLAS